MLKLVLVSVLFALLTATSLSAAHAAPVAQSEACNPARPAEAGKIETTLQSGGLDRYFEMYLPTSYDGVTPLPIVMGIHGLTSNPSQQRQFSRWDELGEREGFISVYPAGTGTPRRWNAGGTFENSAAREINARIYGEPADDVTFFRDLLDHLEATYCIDPTRVYATGLSNGGGMSNRLACEMADRITAIGTVAGAYTELEDGCNPSRPVPVIAFHGGEDPIVAYQGEQFSETVTLPFIEDWAAEWAERNGCGTPLVVETAAPDVIIVREWLDCDADALVTLYTLPDGGHTWPGGLVLPEFLVGITRVDIDASAIMWEFFQDYSL
ncbi:MAG: PHB depolymerase family esterase [Chloroflexota bacterium]|nr:PHB depolymerase family esterase [Chloroflexota bacterium]